MGISTSEVRQVFERIKGNWPRFEHPASRVEEWQRAFSQFSAIQLNRALDEYILKSKWEPKISELYALIQPIRLDSSKNSAELDERWRYVKWQLGRGLAYHREKHPAGRRVWYSRISECDLVGQWMHGDEFLDRYLMRGSFDSSKIGETNVWRF